MWHEASPIGGAFCCTGVRRWLRPMRTIVGWGRKEGVVCREALGVAALPGVGEGGAGVAGAASEPVGALPVCVCEIDLNSAHEMSAAGALRKIDLRAGGLS